MSDTELPNPTTIRMWPIRVGNRVVANPEAVQRGLIGHPKDAIFTVKELPSDAPGWFKDENGDLHCISYYVLAEPAPKTPDALRDFGPERLVPRMPGVIVQNKPTQESIDAVVDQIVADRGVTHGDWGDMAGVAQSLKFVLHGAPNWDALTAMQKETLDSVCTKIARIVVGDPNVREHWVDLIGYLNITLGRMGQ